MIKRIGIIAFALVAAFVSGCASVPMESQEEADIAKKFSSPSSESSGLYIYRSGSYGGALKKDVWVDGKCIGETAPNVFFYHEVPGGKEIEVSTESEFSPNALMINVETGINYFIRQYIKFGLFVGGAGLELVDEEEGKKAVQELGMAKKGTCSK